MSQYIPGIIKCLTSYSNLQPDIKAVTYPLFPFIKEDHDLILVHLKDLSITVIFQKNPARYVCTVFPTTEYHINDFNQNLIISKIKITESLDGVDLTIFFHNKKMYISTKKCLNQTENQTFMKTLIDCIKFNLSVLNDNLCYHFVLMTKNKSENLEICLKRVTEKYSDKEVSISLPNCTNVTKYDFESIDQMKNELAKISYIDEINKKITFEGFDINIYENDISNSPYRVIKFQTPIYKKINRLKKKHLNINKLYLELYQHNELNEYAPFFSKYYNEIIHRISTSVKTIASEILELYHLTRNKQNNEIYKHLPTTYKKVLYILHGIYITHRKKEFNRKKDIILSSSSVLNVHDVYQTLKNLSFTDLEKIYYERMTVLNEDKERFYFIKKDCIATVTQSALMFIS